MPIDPHMIPRRPREIGAASRAVDLERRMRTQEATKNFVGSGASVTGGWIGTSDTGASVYMQGPLFGTPGLFCTDPSGNVTVTLTSAEGLSLFADAGGTINPWNAVGWYTGTVGSPTQIAYVAGTPKTGWVELDMVAEAAGGNVSGIVVQASGTGANRKILAYVGVTNIAVILNNNGNGSWPGAVGMWGSSGPSSQPAHPTTLADVINILTNYGQCA